MTSKEALKRIRQETAPATYMKNFDKKECCDVIEKDLDVLEILKSYFSELVDGAFVIDEMFIPNKDACEQTQKEYQKIKEWLENENENK